MQMKIAMQVWFEDTWLRKNASKDSDASLVLYVSSI